MAYSSYDTSAPEYQRRPDDGLTVSLEVYDEIRSEAGDPESPRRRLGERFGFGRLRQWARGVKRDVIALYVAGRDPRTPLAAKVLAVVVVAYALSPIDLIPDFIPVLGYLDDLIIVPLGILAATRLVPRPLFEEFRRRAAEIETRPVSRAGAAAIVVLWVVAAVLLVRLVWPG